MTAEIVRTEVHYPAVTSREERRWWKVDGKDAARKAAESWTELRRKNIRRAEWAEFWRLYSDDGQAERVIDGRLGRLRSLNACHATTQTCLAHIAKNRPRPLFLTHDGDDAQQRRAMSLTTYIDGLYSQMSLHAVGQTVFRDAMVTGTGYAMFWADVDAEDVRVEYIPTGELEVDPDDASCSGGPRSIFRRYSARRGELAARYPEHVEAIETAQPATQTRPEADLVQVVEAWHLPSRRVRWYDADGKELPNRAKGARAETDGRHVVALTDAADNPIGVLLDEPWTWPRHHVLPLYWEPPTPARGFWGIGLVELIAGKQQELNDLSRDVQTAHTRGGRPMIFVEEQSDVDIDDLSNEIMTVVKYKHQPPVFQVTPTLAPQVYGEREKTWMGCFEESGVSHSNATGQKPAGVEAAVAIREVNDLSGTRFVVKAQAYERWFLDAARICVDLARWLYTEHEIDVKVKGNAGKFLKSIKWSEVDLEDDAYTMDLFPASTLPTTPQGRMQMIVELKEAELISPEMAQSLLELPDIEGARGMSLGKEAQDYAVSVIGRIMEGKHADADPRCDLGVLLDMALANFLRASRPESKVPEGVREALSDLIDTVLRWQKDIAAAVQGGADPRAAADDIARGAAPPAGPPPLPPMGPMGPEMPPGAGAPPGPPVMSPPGLDPGLAPPMGAPPMPPGGPIPS